MENTLHASERLTVPMSEAAKMLGISTAKMYELAKIKGFPSVQIGRRMVVSIKGLERWVEKRAEEGWQGA